MSNNMLFKPIPILIGKTGSLGGSYRKGMAVQRSINFVPGQKSRIAMDVVFGSAFQFKAKTGLGKQRLNFSIQDVFFYPCTLKQAMEDPSKTDFIVIADPSEIKLEEGGKSKRVDWKKLEIVLEKIKKLSSAKRDKALSELSEVTDIRKKSLKEEMGEVKEEKEPEGKDEEENGEEDKDEESEEEDEEESKEEQEKKEKKVRFGEIKKEIKDTVKINPSENTGAWLRKNQISKIKEVVEYYEDKISEKEKKKEKIDNLKNQIESLKDKLRRPEKERQEYSDQD